MKLHAYLSQLLELISNRVCLTLRSCCNAALLHARIAHGSEFLAGESLRHVRLSTAADAVAGIGSMAAAAAAAAATAALSGPGTVTVAVAASNSFTEAR